MGQEREDLADAGNGRIHMWTGAPTPSFGG